MRLFIALELPDTVQQEMHRIQQQIGPTSYRTVKWVGSYAFHITLRFLGEVPDALAHNQVVPLVCENTTLHTWQDAPISLGALGAFPSLKQPQTLWVGLRGNITAITQLHQTLTRALEPLGFAPEQRPFSPHITIGRVRRTATIELATLIRTLERPPTPREMTWEIGRPVVIQSILTPSGPRYQRL